MEKTESVVNIGARTLEEAAFIVGDNSTYTFFSRFLSFFVTGFEETPAHPGATISHNPSQRFVARVTSRSAENVIKAPVHE